MTSVYEEEKKAISHGKKGENNLMTSLVRASQAVTELEADAIDKDREGPQLSQVGLTEQEIYGNIFLFNFAGHDTTANALAFGIILIATRLDVQDWIAEEMGILFNGQDPGKSSYTEKFARWKHCLAVTVRREPVGMSLLLTYNLVRNCAPLHSYSYGKDYRSGPTTPQNRREDLYASTSYHDHPQLLSIAHAPSSLACALPRMEAFLMDQVNEHFGCQQCRDRRYPPSQIFCRVCRFVEFPKAANPFVERSGGARVYPGRKFLQVEFVGVLVGLFREYRIQPVRLDGEADAAARRRLRGFIKEDMGMELLLQLMHPEQVVLTCEKRI